MEKILNKHKQERAWTVNKTSVCEDTLMNYIRKAVTQDASRLAEILNLLKE